MKEKDTENTGIHVACFVVPGGVCTQNPLGLEAPLFVDNSQNPLNKILDTQKTFCYVRSCDAL